MSHIDLMDVHQHKEHPAMPENDTSPKPAELLRFRITEPMPITKLYALLEAVGADDGDTVRTYNGLLLIERPPVPA